MQFDTLKRSGPSSGSGQSKVPRGHEPPVAEPKVKAAKTEIRIVCNVEAIIIEEVGLEEQWEAYPLDFEEEELGKSEEDGPPHITDEQLAELDSAAALDEVRKLHELQVIVPMSPDPTMLNATNRVDTALVYDWRCRDEQWKRRCRIVAREYREGQTNEEQ